MHLASNKSLSKLLLIFEDMLTDRQCIVYANILNMKLICNEQIEKMCLNVYSSR